ncbi:hydantoinase B/oxoprolinase family protein [Nonomuraea sp. NPDC049486]|uniref:hydantoinase B/oxoprolinase family protein n=1 Tax=Nonomuraea sp. NPDC049486 TaxID=3155773 RepID=UPI00343B6450
MTGSAKSAVTLQVFGNALHGLANELQVSMIRAAYSPIIKEMFDCSAGLISPDGEYLALADGIPLQLGVLSTVARELAPFAGDLGPGDVLVTNDPATGSPHLNDYLTVAPVLVDGYLAGYVSTLMHHADVGGKTPGSMPADATEMFAEGMRCPPVRLVRAGQVNEELMSVLLANSRLPGSMRGDLDAQIAGTLVGVERMTQLVRRYGTAVFDRLRREYLDYSEALVRAELKEFRPGTYAAARTLELHHDPGSAPELVRVHAEVDVAGDGTLAIDLSGSDPQIALPFNVVLSNSRSAALVALRCFLSDELPMNAGIERCVRVTCLPGRVTNPELPAPVGARAALAALVNEAMLDAMGQAHSSIRAAGSSGGTTMPYVWAHANGILIDNSTTGGMGATSRRDGASVVDNCVTNAMSYPNEVLEQDHPVLIEEVRLRRGSGGAGHHDGGDGLVRRVRFLADGVLSLRGYRTLSGPPGADGGADGTVSRWTLIRDGHERPLAPQQTGITTLPGDVLLIETPGGGGFGPAERTSDGA